MVEELIKKFLEAGVHFGHQTKRWNPKMKRFIFGHRSGIYIIDLEKTLEHLNYARDFIKDLTAKGGKILFVGTKKQAQMVIEKEAKNCEMFYVNNRWLGGLLTNFQTVRKSIDKLENIENMSKNGVWENLKKKETIKLTKEKEKLLRDLGGIRDMKQLPQAIFVVDPKREEIAVREANKLGIPIVAIIDTNCNPDPIDYPVPGNDDALKSVSLISSLISQAVKEGKSEFDTGSKINQKKQQEENKSAGTAGLKETSAPEAPETKPAAEQAVQPVDTTQGNEDQDKVESDS